MEFHGECSLPFTLLCLVERNLCPLYVTQNHRTPQVGRDPQGSSTPTLGPTQHRPNPMSQSGVPALPELRHYGRAHRPVMQNLSLTPSCPSPTQPHAVPSGPVAVTQSRAQHCLSAPHEELQLPKGLRSAPVLWAEATPGLPFQWLRSDHVPVSA